MKSLRLAAAAGSLAFSPASAQHQGHDAQPMPGMTMPPQPRPQPAPPRQQPAPPPQPQSPPPPPAGAATAAEHPAEAPPEPMAGMDMGSTDVMGRPAMTGALGAYSMTREASGTAWQPDASIHGGIETMRGGWMLMGHALLNGVYDTQGGRRGDDKAFVSGMLMGIAQRPFANGNILQLKAMLSPDPFMGSSGYPLLLASGETANGRDPLVDRQHPHDLFMELSASYSLRLGGKASAFLYGGLPGEPAFGPPAFMHRMSILDSPEAPISHHWLDSTHITFGVVTAGFVYDNVKIEASRFHGREPDQHRFDIETGPLDSTAVRVSWNPTAELSFQGSWAHLKSPEQLEPGTNQTKWSASGIYTQRLGAKGWWSTTAAWGRRSSGGDKLDAWVLESAVNLDDWTLFGRGETVQNNELLFVGGRHGPTFDVGKVSLGVIRDFRLAGHVKFGLGGLYAFNFVPAPLKPFYGGDPKGAMAFVRLKID